MVGLVKPSEASKTFADSDISVDEMLSLITISISACLKFQIVCYNFYALRLKLYFRVRQT